MKHAYLIMAHHRPDLLRELLDAIDDSRNDIYLHVDKKSTDIFDLNMKYAKLYQIDSMSINWGGYSQVEGTYRLLKKATTSGEYQYYHFLTGATFPLKNQNEMHRFFDTYEGKQFIGYVSPNMERKTIERVKYHAVLPEAGAKKGVTGKLLRESRNMGYSIQKLLRIDYFKHYNMEYKKGIAYWSITDELARFLLQKEGIAREMLLHSVSGDEVFVQTLTYNSLFKEAIYQIGNEWEGSQREVPWGQFGNRPGNNFAMEDLDYLINSNRCFALKFEGKDGLKLINSIKKYKQI